MIQPLADLSKKYNKELKKKGKKTVMDDPNAMLEFNSKRIVRNISKEAPENSIIMDSLSAKNMFNADLAMSSPFDVDESFSRVYSEGALLGFHKMDIADMFILILYDRSAKSRLDKLLEPVVLSLKFNK